MASTKMCAELEKCVEDACLYIPKIKDAMARLDALHTVLSLKHDKCKQQVSVTVGRLQQQLTDIHTSMNEKIELEVARKKQDLDSKKEILACRIRSTASLCLDIEKALKLTDSEELKRRSADILSSWKELMSFYPEPSPPLYFEFVPSFRKVSELLTPSSVGFVRTLLSNPLDVEVKISAGNEMHIMCHRGETAALANCLQVTVKGMDDLPLPITPTLESNSLQVDTSGLVAGSYLVNCQLYGVDVLSSPVTLQIEGDKSARPSINAMLQEVEDRVKNLTAMSPTKKSEGKNINSRDPWAADANGDTASNALVVDPINAQLKDVGVTVDKTKEQLTDSGDNSEFKFSFNDGTKLQSIPEPAVKKPFFSPNVERPFSARGILSESNKSVDTPVKRATKPGKSSSLIESFADLSLKSKEKVSQDRSCTVGSGAPSPVTKTPKKDTLPRKSFSDNDKFPGGFSSGRKTSLNSVDENSHKGFRVPAKSPSTPKDGKSLPKSFGGFGTPARNKSDSESDKSPKRKVSQGFDKNDTFGAWRSVKESGDSVMENTGILGAAYLCVECGSMGLGKGPKLKFPIGITRSRGNEDIIICDSGNHMLKVFNWKGQFQFHISGKGKASFKRPSAVVTNELGDIFVKDDIQISMFRADGEFVRHIGIGVLQRPYGLALTNEGHLLVIDHGRKVCDAAVVLFTQDGALVKHSTFDPITKMQFSKCRFLAVWKDSLYVVDLGNSVVYVTDFEGKEKLRFGQFGKQDGDFREPSGISVHPNGHVYIADSKNDRIQIFSSDGTFLTKLSLNSALQRPSDIHVTSNNYLLVSNYLKHSTQVHLLTAYQSDKKV